MMQLHSDIINDVPILKVEGRVIADDSLRFVKEVKTFGEHEAPKVVLDLQDTTFLDSAAVGIICAAHIERTKNDKTLEIMIDPSSNEFISNLFDTTGLKAVLNITRIH